MRHINLKKAIQDSGSQAALARRVGLSPSMVQWARMTQESTDRVFKVLVDDEGNYIQLDENIGWRKVGFSKK